MALLRTSPFHLWILLSEKLSETKLLQRRRRQWRRVNEGEEEAWWRQKKAMYACSKRAIPDHTCKRQHGNYWERARRQLCWERACHVHMTWVQPLELMEKKPTMLVCTWNQYQNYRGSNMRILEPLWPDSLSLCLKGGRWHSWGDHPISILISLILLLSY